MEKARGRRGFIYAALAGTCAALGSVFGKLAMAGETLERALAVVYEALHLDEATFSWVVVFVRAVAFVLLFVSNALMWNFFTKSMNLSTAIEAVVVNSSFNFFLTAILGSLIFGEVLSLRWLFGASLIVIGVVLLSSPSEFTPTKKAKMKAK